MESTQEFAGFAPTRDGIFYWAPSAAGPRQAIRFLSFADGTTETIFESETLGGPITLSSDSRYLLYSQNDLSADLMLIENFR